MKEGYKRILSKKSQSEIITTVLIILLVLAAIIIVWNVVSSLINKSSSDIKDQSNPVITRTDNFILYADGSMDVSVYYDTGDQKIEKLEFIFEDDSGKTKVITRENINLALKETKVYHFTKAEVGLGNVIKVTVIHIYASNKEGVKASKIVKRCATSADC